MINGDISRRSFIGGMAAAGLLPVSASARSLSSPLGGEDQGEGGIRNNSTGDWQMRLSASTVAFTSLTVEDACRRIAELGFEGVDIWCPFRGCTHLTQVQERLGADGLKEVLRKNNLKLNSFSVYRGGLQKYADVLGDVGGGVAVRGSAGRVREGENLTGRMKEFIESLKPLVELAEEKNIYLAIENHGNALLDSLDSFKAFTDINDSKHLGIALAPYHLQGIKASVPEAIKISGDQLFFFYAWQRSGGTGQLPGHGDTDFTPWIKALADIKYQRYVNPFMHHEPEPDEMSEALKKSKEYLENLGNSF